MDPRIDIITTLNTLFWATDHHDWDTLAHVFSDQVTLDYGEPELLSPQEIIDRWRPIFEGLDAHQHLVSNHLITLRDDAATATASFTSMPTVPGHLAAITDFPSTTPQAAGRLQVWR